MIMALDHSRDFFHADSLLFYPEDLTRTSVPLFFTRWITHFCAPVFFFLAGTSAFLVGSRKGKRELCFFLLTRGAWLVLLELTVINFGWSFNITLPLFAMTTIWALGISMIAMSLLIFLPFRVILLLGLVIIFGHNLLDSVHVNGSGVDALVWSVLHDVRFGVFTFLGRPFDIGYPALPWIGTMTVGYCFGYLYQDKIEVEQRQKWLLWIGLAATALFFLIRAINVYGDPQTWSLQPSASFSLLSFLNVTKYPPSLLFLLITLGSAILFLSFAEIPLKGIGQALVRIGRVPMFFYVAHIYLLHLIALFAGKFTGYAWSDMVSTANSVTPSPPGYGFSLLVTYIVWIVVVLLLYPLCMWYERYKASNKEKWWLSYL